MKWVAVLVLLAGIGLACVSFDLDGRRFRCDGITNTCDPGYACSAEHYCAPIVKADAAMDDGRRPDGTTTEMICDNDIDDDLDGHTDCADSDCPGALTCGPGCICPGGNGVPTEANCADGIDNDGDLSVDCLDPDCTQCEEGSLMCCPDGACRPSC